MPISSSRALLIVLICSGMARPEPAVGVYVGPRSGGRFVAADKEVLDSVKDISNELRARKRVRVVTARDEAEIVLEVLSRGSAPSPGGGAVAAPIRGSASLIPIGTIGIATILRVGTHEKVIVFPNCKSRRHCARRVAKYVETWVAVNPTVGSRR